MFDFARRRRIAEEAAENWRVNFLAARNSEHLWKAQLSHSWKVIAAQQKGLNRQRRLIKRLQAQLKPQGDAITAAASRRAHGTEDAGRPPPFTNDAGAKL